MFISIFDENWVSKQNCPRWDAAFCYSVCLCPMKRTPGSYIYRLRSRESDYISLVRACLLKEKEGYALDYSICLKSAFFSCIPYS